MASYPNYQEKPEYVVLEAMNRIGLHPKHRHLIGKLAVDFAFPELKLAVEIDGEHHHEAIKELRGAAKRDEYIKSMGWRVYRLTQNKAIQSPQLIAQSISGFIKQLAPAKRIGNISAPKKAGGVRSKINAENVKIINIDMTKGEKRKGVQDPEKKAPATKKQPMQNYVKPHTIKKIPMRRGANNSGEIKNLILALAGILAVAYLLIFISNI